MQVKTGEIATKTHSWIDGAFKYSKLLLDLMGNPTGMEVTILLGTEPSKPPVLGKRKRTALKKAKYPASWKIRYLPNCVGSLAENENPVLNLALYKKLATEFSNFVAVVSSAETENEQPSPDILLDVTTHS